MLCGNHLNEENIYDTSGNLKGLPSRAVLHTRICITKVVPLEQLVIVVIAREITAQEIFSLYCARNIFA